MKIIFFFLLSLATQNILAQISYYQQQVDYKMNIDVEVSNFTYNGDQKITYKNNSPDTLKKFYFHLYWNAFKPNSMMSQRIEHLGAKGDSRLFSGGKNELKDLKESQTGDQSIEYIKQNGRFLKYSIQGTILEVELDQPILPNSETSFQMKWKAKIPDVIRRGGKNNTENVALTMTQWYPKVCAYDYDGWHTNEYLGKEFFAPFGNFFVEILIDKNYSIGAGGVLINAEEIGHGYSSTQTQKPNNGKLKWKFEAKNIHDFAWAADPNFVVDKQEISKNLSVFYVHKKESAIQQNWDKNKPFIKQYFGVMADTFGKYPYPQYSFIQGGDGGMEYGMCTIILGEGKNSHGLLELMVHEASHSWFQQVLATNESEKAWLDEGFTSFATSFAMNQLVPNKKRPNPHIESISNYLSIAGTEAEEPMNLIADHVDSSFGYGVAAYSKGETYLAQLSYIIGEKVLMESLKEYYQTWQFKHPTQRDFEHIVSKKSGLYLRWFYNYFTETTSVIDYQIKSVSEKNGKTIVTLKNNGKIPMPIDLFVIDQKNATEIHYIPLQMMRGEKQNEFSFPILIHKDWQWTNLEYELEIDKPKNDIKMIMIDATQRMADKNFKDNSYNN
jgi:hypothetical protein